MEGFIAERIDEFIDKLKNLNQIASLFTVIIDNLFGNSFVEDPQKTLPSVMTYYNQTPQQVEILRLQAEAQEEQKEMGTLTERGRHWSAVSATQ